MAIELLPFDIATFLTDDESIVEYLTIAFESNNPDNVIKALGVVARARGADRLAFAGGLEPEALNGILEGRCEPDLTALLKIMKALGVKLSASMVA